MNKNKFYTKLTSGIFYFSILLFIIAFNFSDNGGGGWQQQFIPEIGNRTLTGISFVDSLNGFAITNSDSNKAYILKTTNGGDNWNVNHIDSPFTFTKFLVLNENIMYAGGTDLIKTSNKGASWLMVNTPFLTFLNDFSVLNEDTILFAMSEGLTGGVFRTTNGGTNW